MIIHDLESMPLKACRTLHVSFFAAENVPSHADHEQPHRLLHADFIANARRKQQDMLYDWFMWYNYVSLVLIHPNFGKTVDGRLVVSHRARDIASMRWNHPAHTSSK